MAQIFSRLGGTLSAVLRIAALKVKSIGYAGQLTTTAGGAESNADLLVGGIQISPPDDLDGTKGNYLLPGNNTSVAWFQLPPTEGNPGDYLTRVDAGYGTTAWSSFSVIKSNGTQFQNTTSDIQFNISSTTNAANFLQTAGSVTGTDVILEASGTDNDVSIQINAKGAGNVKVNQGNLIVGNGALRLAGSATLQTTTPVGTNVASKIDIPASAAGAFSQIVALGITAGSASTSRVLSVFDARASAHQPSLGVFNPSEDDMVGFSWDGNNNTAYIKVLNSGASVGFNFAGNERVLFSDTTSHFATPVQLNSNAHLRFNNSALVSAPSGGYLALYSKTNNRLYIKDSSNNEIILLNSADNLSNVANANTALNNLLPAQTGNNGKALITDGTNVSWQTVSSGTTLPSQTGNNGRYLTTNGTNLAWGILGTITSQNANNVSITGGSISSTDIFLRDVSASPAAGNLYTSGNTLRYRDASNIERLLLNATDNLSNLANANTALNNILPTQTGNAGKVLTTDGTNTSWATAATSNVVVSKTSSDPTISRRTFTYSSGGDANGVFYFAGTNWGASGSWSNPASNGYLGISSSSLQLGTLASVVDRVSSDAYTSNAVNSWLQFDLGPGRAFRPNGFTWRTRNNIGAGAYALRNWKLQGSNDGTIFTDIQTWTNDNTQNTSQADAWSYWAVTQPSTAYRYLRIYQFGVNSNSDYYIVFNECEMYGELLTTQTSPTGYLQFNGDYSVPYYGAGSASLGTLGVYTLPTQTGNAGKWLTTDGSNASWSSLGTLATQNTDSAAITVIQSSGLRVQSAAGEPSLNVSNVSSAVNWLDIQGAVAGSAGPIISSAGADTNLDVRYRTKGSGVHRFQNPSGNDQFRVGNVSLAVNYLQISGSATGNATLINAAGSDTNIGIITRAKGTGTIFFQNGNNNSNLQVIDSGGTTANYATITGALTTAAPTISVAGSDTNIDLRLGAKGTGNVRIAIANTSAQGLTLAQDSGTTANSNRLFFESSSGGHSIYNSSGSLWFNSGAIPGSTSGVNQFRIAATGSAVNTLEVTGAATGNAPILRAQGSDTNVGINIQSKNTGAIQLQTAGGSVTSFKANWVLNGTNYVQVTPGDSGVNPIISVDGGDSNIGLQFRLKGSSRDFRFQNSSSQNVVIINGDSSIVNYFSIGGGATGNPIRLMANGTDSNVGISLQPQGTGVVAISANALQVPELAATPTGNPPAGTQWIYIKSSDGKLYRKNSAGTETLIGG